MCTYIQIRDICEHIRVQNVFSAIMHPLSYCSPVFVIYIRVANALNYRVFVSSHYTVGRH